MITVTQKAVVISFGMDDQQRSYYAALNLNHQDDSKRSFNGN
ncbi:MULTISPECIES: hypothetical protein [unclassified Moorena]|nr:MULTISPECIES: hypothetical protein [unclassified Moorena]